MGRSPCCSKEGLNRGAWTAHEDKILTDYIRLHGEGKWRNLPKRAGLKRCGKSCRLRWLNYLRPDIKRGNISSDEEELIIRLHNLLGNRWSLIAGRLPGRTDNEIKNYWNTNLGKKIKDSHQTTNTTCSRRPCVQTNGKSTQKNPKSQLISTFLLSPPKVDSHVVRTKATKCSKAVFINSQLPHSSSSTQLHNNSEAEAKPLNIVDNAVASNSMSNQVEPVGDNGFLSLPSSEEKELSTDLLIDFNVGDICLSDLLNSDFSNMCNFSYSNDHNNPELLSPACSDQPLMLSDEIFNDWTQSNLADETNVSNNLYSFNSFLESSEEDEMLAE